MSKASTGRRLSDNEAMAFQRNIRISPYKLNLVAQLIRGKNIDDALADLEFSRRRIAVAVKKVVESAVANAENNHQLDVDRLVVSEARVGRAFAMRRYRPRARGRMGRITKPYSNLTVVVREREEKS